MHSLILYFLVFLCCAASVSACGNGGIPPPPPKQKTWKEQKECEDNARLSCVKKCESSGAAKKGTSDCYAKAQGAAWAAFKKCVTNGGQSMDDSTACWNMGETKKDSGSGGGSCVQKCMTGSSGCFTRCGNVADAKSKQLVSSCHQTTLKSAKAAVSKC